MPNIPIAFIRQWYDRPLLSGGVVLICLGSWLRYRLHEWQIDAEEEMKNSHTPGEKLTRRLRFYRQAANFMFVVGAVSLALGLAQFFW